MVRCSMRCVDELRRTDMRPLGQRPDWRAHDINRCSNIHARLQVCGENIDVVHGWELVSAPRIAKYDTT